MLKRATGTPKAPPNDHAALLQAAALLDRLHAGANQGWVQGSVGPVDDPWPTGDILCTDADGACEVVGQMRYGNDAALIVALRPLAPLLATWFRHVAGLAVQGQVFMPVAVDLARAVLGETDPEPTDVGSAADRPNPADVQRGQIVARRGETLPGALPPPVGRVRVVVDGRALVGWGLEDEWEDVSGLRVVGVLGETDGAQTACERCGSETDDPQRVTLGTISDTRRETWCPSCVTTRGMIAPSGGESRG